MINSRYKIGSLFNVPIYLHGTLILVYMISAAGAWLHPGAEPRYIKVLQDTFAITLLYGSVLLHEFAHVLMARAFKVPTKDVTMFMFGGIASLSSELRTAKALFWVSIVGPIFSLSLAALLFVVLAFLYPNNNLMEMAQLPYYMRVLGYACAANFMIAFFNFVPALPLDGGGVFKGIAWYITKSETKADKLSILLSKVLLGTVAIMAVLMCFGIQVPVFGVGIGSGLWLLMITGFIYLILRVHEAKFKREQSAT